MGMKAISQIKAERFTNVLNKEVALVKYKKTNKGMDRCSARSYAAVGEEVVQEMCDQIAIADAKLEKILKDPSVWNDVEKTSCFDRCCKKKKKDEGPNLDGLEIQHKLRGDFTPSTFDPPKDVVFSPDHFSDTAYITFKSITTARLAVRQTFGKE